MIHFEQIHGALRETSPAGTGLFSPSAEESVGVSGVVGGATPLLEPVLESGTATGRESWMVQSTEEYEGEETSRELNHLASDRDSETCSNGVASGRAYSSEDSSSEFPQVARSSKLVDRGDIQSRRDRAESREHNMPPMVSLREDFPVASSPITGSISFTASGFSRLSPSEKEIRASTPTGYIDASGNHVPRVFVERPFSPPERDGSSIAAGDFAHSSDWSLGEPISSNPSPRNSRSPLGPSSPEAVANEEPVVPSLFSKGKAKEVELADISSLPGSASTYSQKERVTESKTLSTVTPPSSIPLTNSSPQLEHPSPSPPTTYGSHPRAHVSYTAFPHSPQLYKSSLATPHVLGNEAEPASLPQPRARANSNRVQGSHLKDRGCYQQPASATPSSKGEQGSTEFLEDFIDGF